MSEKKYRLVTRSDMDGLVCGTLLRSLFGNTNASRNSA